MVRFGYNMLIFVWDVMILTKLEKFLADQLVYSLKRKFSRLTFNYRSSFVNWIEWDKFMRNIVRNLPFYHYHGSSSLHLNLIWKKNKDAGKFYKWLSNWMFKVFPMLMISFSKQPCKFSKLNNEKKMILIDFLLNLISSL